MTEHVVMFSGGVGSWAAAKRVATLLRRRLWAPALVPLQQCSVPWCGCGTKSGRNGGMAELEVTEGEWRAEEAPKEPGMMHINVYPLGGGTSDSDGVGWLADVSGFCPGDAYLIAAAPDLLAACEALAAYVYSTTNPGSAPDAFRQARAAIAKARGEGSA